MTWTSDGSKTQTSLYTISVGELRHAWDSKVPYCASSELQICVFHRTAHLKQQKIRKKPETLFERMMCVKGICNTAHLVAWNEMLSSHISIQVVVCLVHSYVVDRLYADLSHCLIILNLLTNGTLVSVCSSETVFSDMSRHTQLHLGPERRCLFEETWIHLISGTSNIPRTVWYPACYTCKNMRFFASTNNRLGFVFCVSSVLQSSIYDEEAGFWKVHHHIDFGIRQTRMVLCSNEQFVLSRHDNGTREFRHRTLLVDDGVSTTRAIVLCPATECCDTSDITVVFHPHEPNVACAVATKADGKDVSLHIVDLRTETILFATCCILRA